MGSEMTKLRKEDLSLFYYIKDAVLSEFVEREEHVRLRKMPEISVETGDPSCDSIVYETLSSMIPSPVERGRGWCYFDGIDPRDGTGTMVFPARYCTSCSGIPEQSNRVKVYQCVDTASGTEYTLIHNSEYMIDYMDGRIITSGTCNPTHVTYDWNYISVVDEWAAVQAADPPVVVIDVSGTDKAGYQLGGGKKSMRKVDLHIFATDPAERNDIAETLYDGLYNRSCPLYDFPRGTVLDYDGTWYDRKNKPRSDTSTEFPLATVSDVIGNLEFENVTARHVSLPLLMTRNRDEVMLSDLNAYRSKISFDLVSYTSR